MRVYRKWLGFAALVPSTAMIFLDQTILPVALPVIQREFHVGNSSLQWTINAYLLTIAMCVLAFGKLSTWFGARASLLGGTLLFACASALCSLSPNIGWLTCSRVLQGLGASLMLPVQFIFLAMLFPPHQRGKVTGLTISVGSVFMILGPLVGGYFTEHLSWRWNFWINLPIAAIGLTLGSLFLPSPPPHREKIDLWGFVCFACGSGLLTTAFMQAQDWGWGSFATLSCFGGACLAIFCLLRRERTASHPFLDLAVLKHPSFTASCLSISAIQFIAMISVFRVIYFQTVLDYTPTETGVLAFISSMPILFLASLGGYLSDRISPKLPIAIGFFLLVSSFLWLAIFSLPTLPFLLIGIIGFGMGLPLIFTPSYASAIGVVPPSKLGVAFGMLTTLRNLAATMGVALIGWLSDTVRSTKFLSYAALTPQIEFLSEEELLQYSRGVPMGPIPALQSLIRKADIDAFSVTHYVLAFFLLAAFGAVFILYRRKSRHKIPGLGSEGWD